MTVSIMKRESRECGTRVEGALYLCGNGVPFTCYRLPMEIPECECCGQTIEFFRSIKKFNPKRLFGDCDDDTHLCHKYKCKICFPPRRAWVMWVGAQYYTVDQFIEEARRIGVSKRIRDPAPEDLRRGDWVWLCHKKTFYHPRRAKNKFDPGVFFAFQISDVQKIVSEEQAVKEDYIELLEGKGYTPVLERDEI